MSLSEKTLWCLRQAGWHNGYTANIDKYLQSSTEAGCEVPGSVREFLERYGNLKIIVPLFYQPDMTMVEVMQSKKYDYFHLNPREAANSEYCTDWQRLAKAVNIIAVYPIGEYLTRMLLFMTPDAQVYEILDGHVQQHLHLVGTNGEDALNVLCSRGEI